MTKQAVTVRTARKLRREMTKPEVLLWQRLRGDPEGLRFRRQHPVGSFVLDFYCPKARLAIEIDGIVHDMGMVPARDENRTAWLKANAIEVVRIPAGEVLNRPDGVAAELVRFAASRVP